VAALVKRGHLLVAAVGNDGPAAPPLYPASYPGVIGVTAVDARRRILPEAGRGAQVAFAAPGADMVAADMAGGYTAVRGTSFAAPLVAGLLATRLRSPDRKAAQRAVAELAATALDLGEPGRDPVYGYGLVAAEARIDPGVVSAPEAAGVRR
jgi:subtilisin family serine protease